MSKSIIHLKKNNFGATPTRATLLLIGWKSREYDLSSRILAYWNTLKWPNIYGINQHFLTRRLHSVVYLSMATFKKFGSLYFSGSDLYQVKMSEFYFGSHIRWIRPLLITLKSPAARTFFKNFKKSCITTEYANQLELLDTFNFIYPKNFLWTIFWSIKITSIITAGYQNFKMKPS